MSPSATSFLTLKQDALRGFRQRQFVTGTVASFNTTMFIDSSRQEPQGEWDRTDTWLKFTSGPAIGTEVRVTGFSAGNQSVLFAPSVPSLNTTTTYQLAKTFNDADMKLNVNSALRDTYGERMIQSFATAAETDGQYFISVPSAASNAIADLIRIERSVGTTNSNYNFKTLFEGADYSVEEANGTARAITAYPGVSGTNVRFHYRRPVNEFANDTDVTDEPVSLILTGTRLWMAMQEGDPQQIQMYQKLFETAKADYAKAREVVNTRVPRIVVKNFGSFR